MDPILADNGDTRTHPIYAYANDKPTNQIDPTGLEAEDGFARAFLRGLYPAAAASLSGSSVLDSFPLDVDLCILNGFGISAQCNSRIFATTVTGTSLDDSMTKILAALGSRQLGQLTVIGHGSQGDVTFGNGRANQVTEKNFADALPELSRLQGKFALSGDAYIAQCEVALGTGRNILMDLSDVWGVPVYGWTGSGNALLWPGEFGGAEDTAVRCTNYECVSTVTSFTAFGGVW